jgi:hypothetical protein
MEYSRHHRHPKSQGGSNFPPNTIKVPHKKHEAWHVLFGTKTPQEIVDDLNNIWFYPDYEVSIKERPPIPDQKIIQIELPYVEPAY